MNDDRCKPSTFGTTWTLGGVTSRTSLKCLPPLDSPERIFGGISSSQSSARTPMRRAATLEKTWKMSNRNGRIRSIISSYTRRMSLALLALIWIEPFLALTLTTLQHFRQLKTQKLYMHVDGRPRKVRTVSRGEPCLMYETRLSRMIMQLPPAQMANRDGDAGMETMLWDINIIPNELDNGYLMLPPGVLHMSALGRFGRFTLFSPRVSHSKHLPVFCFVLCFGFGGVCCFVVFLFPVLQVFGIPNSPRSLDLDDRQGFIASSAMQQKKKNAVAPAANTHTPTAFLPHSSSIGSAQQDSRADVRLRAHLHAPPATIIPAEDDDELLDATPDIDVPVSTAVSSALTHLEQAIDDMHSASPKPLSFDPLFYLALSSLPLTYPWPILTIDLKNFLPLMDRHVLMHLVAAQASVNPRFQHPAPVLGSFFKDLAHAVVHTILAPLNSQHMRPNLPPRVFTGEFWHAHFNYAALRTDPPSQP